MKKRVLKLILMGVTYTFIGLVFQFLFINMLWATETNAQRVKNIKDVMVRVEIQDKTLIETFNILERKSPIKFVYDKKDAFLTQKFNIEKQTLSMEDILVANAREKKLKFKLINNNIAVSEPVTYIDEVIEVVDTRIEIKGKVTDENGDSMPGATITIEGTTTGTATNVDGNFSIDVDEGAVLVVSFIGYQTKRITVSNQSQIEVSMELDDSSLEEIVVVGYGTARRKDISGAVGTVKLEDSELSLSSTNNALQSLQGTIAGVNVGPQNSPGTTPGILVRGQNSINGSNSPLIVLDGIIYLGSIADINPDDIAVIDVLKDASAAAVYGSRSANGVVVITTKSGKTDKPTIKYDGSTGVNRWQNQFDMMNLDRWTEKYVAQTPSFNSPADIVFDDVTRTRLFAQGVDTDWMDLISRNGFIQNHQVSVSGRSDRINYYFSGGYNSNEGAIVGDNFHRISVRSKLDADVTDWLKVGIDGAYNNNDYSGLDASVSSAYFMAPHGYPYRWDNMPENPETNTGKLLERYPTGSSIQSPLWNLGNWIEDVDKRNFYRFATYALVKIPKIDGLTY
ncbi:MAG: SusC/RagA family TonB-linked outer membrane protein, partial [Anditalea sp.]